MKGSKPVSFSEPARVSAVTELWSLMPACVWTVQSVTEPVGISRSASCLWFFKLPWYNEPPYQSLFVVESSYYRRLCCKADVSIRLYWPVRSTESGVCRCFIFFPVWLQSLRDTGFVEAGGSLASWGQTLCSDCSVEPCVLKEELWKWLYSCPGMLRSLSTAQPNRFGRSVSDQILWFTSPARFNLYRLRRLCSSRTKLNQSKKVGVVCSCVACTWKALVCSVCTLVFKLAWQRQRCAVKHTSGFSYSLFCCYCCFCCCVTVRQL